MQNRTCKTFCDVRTADLSVSASLGPDVCLERQCLKKRCNLASNLGMTSSITRTKCYNLSPWDADSSQSVPSRPTASPMAIICDHPIRGAQLSTIIHARFKCKTCIEASFLSKEYFQKEKILLSCNFTGPGHRKTHPSSQFLCHGTSPSILSIVFSMQSCALWA